MIARPEAAPLTLGRLTRADRHRDGLDLDGTHGTLRLRFLADGLLRVRIAPHGAPPERPSYALDPEAVWPGPAALVFDEEDGHLGLRTDVLAVRVARATGRLGVYTPDGRGVLEEADAPPATDGENNGHATPRMEGTLAFRLRPGERLFGLGDKATGLDRRGGRYTQWNTDAFEFEPGTDPLYKSIPFVLGVTADSPALAYGLFVDTPARTVFDLGHRDDATLAVEADEAALTYYVLHACTPVGVLQAFARLTGRTPMLPKWALGYHQCRYSYATADEVRAVADGFRTRGIPCDALYLDIHYMDGYRVFTWDQAAFPDPAALLAGLKRDGFRTVAIVDPGVKADDPDYDVARDGLARGVFCRYPDGTPFTGEVWPGLCYFPDFTHPDARQWWGERHHALLDAGLDGVWCDMNEPALFTTPGSEVEAGTFPDAVRHDADGHPASHRWAHNVYGMAMVWATAEGLRRLRPARRPFVITRAAYAGTQRHAVAWTGDNTSTWAHLRLARDQCLGLNASGYPFVGADVGGFIGAASGELLARWTQLGALTPLFRNHAGLDTPRQEPWCFGPEVEHVCREAITLRYRLLPYLYTALHRAVTEGLPLLTPLALVHPDDRVIRRDDPAGFYVGDRLLACPVLHEGRREAEVYLPDVPGGWYDFHTGAHHAGGRTLRVAAPLDGLPLYVRAGTALPLGPVVPHTGVAPDALTLHLYPAGDALDGLLYDDAGDGWDFLDGAFHRCRFHGQRDGSGLRVEAEVEGTFTPPWTRWEVVLHGPAPRAVEADGAPVPFTSDDGTGMQFTVAPGRAFTVRY